MSDQSRNHLPLTEAEWRKRQAERLASVRHFRPVSWRCPGCGTVVHFNTVLAGETIKCHRCGAEIEVPHQTPLGFREDKKPRLTWKAVAGKVFDAALKLLLLICLFFAGYLLRATEEGRRAESSKSGQPLPEESDKTGRK